MLKYLLPKIRLDDLLPMVGVSLVGAVIGGIYGIVHDQITFSISPEYFTKLKFHQFDYANFGFGDRIFASTIGFIATAAVGLIATWFLARRLLPDQPRHLAYRQIRNGIACIFSFGLAFGFFGYAYGLWRGPDADYTYWDWATQPLLIEDVWSFVRVAYIHNAGYLGGFLGLVTALSTIRPKLTGETAV